MLLTILFLLSLVPFNDIWFVQVNSGKRRFILFNQLILLLISPLSLMYTCISF